MKKKLVWILFVAFVGIVVYLFLRQGERSEPSEAPPLTALPPPSPQEIVPAEPVEPAAPLYPVEPPPPVAKEIEAPLPPLDESDAVLGAELASLVGMKGLPAWIYPEKMIRRVVVTVDNLPERKVAVEMMPVRPVAGAFEVREGQKGALTIDPANAARYGSYLKLVEAVDIPRLVALYVRFYPLFQQAYIDLGYPNGYFNDRLIETIDDLLAAPDPKRPIRLVQPSVMYKYADPELEALSAGQKMMVRMGAENAGRMKTVLRALRSELVGKDGRPQEE